MFVWNSEKLRVYLLIFCLTMFSCSQEFENSTLNIVNGEQSSSFPAVGALGKKKWNSFQHQCTATLIKEDWLLTAAHCVKGGIGQLVFVVGTKAKNGRFFSLEKSVVHPDYYSNPIGSLFDIALIKLAKPVPSSVAIPMPYNKKNLKAFIGQSVFYLGYGTTSGEASFLGLGTKRSVNLPIDSVDAETYNTKFDDRGLCHGDSGGPGLILIDGVPTIVGLTSASLGCQGGQCKPCSNGSKHTRVDRFADWIASHVEDSFKSCKVNSSRCDCEAACGTDGLCYNSVCSQKTCNETLACLFEVCALDANDGSCSTRCLSRGSNKARQDILSLVDCWGKNCRSIIGSDAERECLQSRCQAQWNYCSAN